MNGLGIGTGRTNGGQISLASHVANLFGFHSRAAVVVSIVSLPCHLTASHPYPY